MKGGKDMRILYYDEDVIVAEEGGETVIFYPYCGCNSGFWFLQTEKLTRSVFDSLPIKIKEKLRMLNLEPD
jgi:hypothetical protein